MVRSAVRIPKSADGGSEQISDRTIHNFILAKIFLIGWLGALVSHEANRQQDKEVMKFLTPRIWQPGMDVPVPTEQAIWDHAARVEQSAATVLTPLIIFVLA